MPIIDASYGGEIALVPPMPSGSFVGDNGFTNGAEEYPYQVTITWGDSGTGYYLGNRGLPGINSPYSTSTNDQYPFSNLPASSNSNPVSWDIYTTTESNTTANTDQATSHTTSYASTTQSTAGSVTLAVGSYHTAPTLATSQTNASDISATGTFWLVPTGYTGGSQLSDFSTQSQVSAGSASVPATYTSHDYQQSYTFYTFGTGTDSTVERDGYVVDNTTTASTQSVYFNGLDARGIAYDLMGVGFTGTTYGNSLGLLYSLASQCGKSINSVPIVSSIYYGILDAVSFTDWTTGAIAGLGDSVSYKFSDATQIIYTTTTAGSGTITNDTTATISLSILSTAVSTQGASGAGSVADGMYRYASWSLAAVAYLGVHTGSDAPYEFFQYVNHLATLAGGQTWTGSDIVGSGGAFGVTYNHASSTVTTSFVLSSSQTTTMSIEYGGNLVIAAHQNITPGNSAISYYIQ